MQIHVQFLWHPHDALKQYLLAAFPSNSTKVILHFPSEAETKSKEYEHIAKAQVLVGWRPTKALLAAATQLKLFINPGAGVQHLMDLFREVVLENGRGITLVNGHGNAYFTAQHAVALLLGLSNKTTLHHQFMLNGKWRTGDKQGASTPMRYRKIGLLGYGAINQKVHRFLAGFDVVFYALKRSWDTYTPSNLALAQTYTPSSLHDFLQQVDTLIIALPHTQKTENLIGEKELELLGKEGLLVNVSRGKVMQEEALYKSLKNKVIKGAAIDVWYNYKPEENEHGHKRPYSKDCPFHELDNVLLSPHRAASPMNDLERWDEVIENIKRMCNNQRPFLNEVAIELGY